MGHGSSLRREGAIKSRQVTVLHINEVIFFYMLNIHFIIRKLKSREEVDEIRFYRATIFSADDKAKEAVIFLIDYAKFLMVT